MPARPPVGSDMPGLSPGRDPTLVAPHAPDTIGILGAGRQALETAGYCTELGITTAFFVEEEPPAYARDPGEFGAPILPFGAVTAAHLAMPMVAAVGDPRVRRRLVERWGGHRFVTVVSPRAWLAADVRVEGGTIVAPFAALNRKVRVGTHVLINVAAVFGHDVSIGDFVTVGPGCTIGGCVTVGDGAVLGIGATVRQGLTIGRSAFVAAGAVVVGDVGDGESVMGVPARPRERP